MSPIGLICGGAICGVKHLVGKRWASLHWGAYRWINRVSFKIKFIFYAYWQFTFATSYYRICNLSEHIGVNK